MFIYFIFSLSDCKSIYQIADTDRIVQLLHDVLRTWIDASIDWQQAESLGWIFEYTHTHNRFTAFLEYVRDHPGKQVPER